MLALEALATDTRSTTNTSLLNHAVIESIVLPAVFEI